MDIPAASLKAFSKGLITAEAEEEEEEWVFSEEVEAVEVGVTSDPTGGVGGFATTYEWKSSFVCFR